MSKSLGNSLLLEDLLNSIPTRRSSSLLSTGYRGDINITDASSPRRKRMRRFYELIARAEESSPTRRAEREIDKRLTRR